MIQPRNELQLINVLLCDIQHKHVYSMDMIIDSIKHGYDNNVQLLLIERYFQQSGLLDQISMNLFYEVYKRKTYIERKIEATNN